MLQKYSVNKKSLIHLHIQYPHPSRQVTNHFINKLQIPNTMLFLQSTSFDVGILPVNGECLDDYIQINYLFDRSER